MSAFEAEHVIHLLLKLIIMIADNVGKGDLCDRTKSIALAQGGIIILCSDGVTGAQNDQREQFSKDSIERIIQHNSQQSAEVIMQRLQSELQAFTADNYLNTERSIIVIKCK
ncbi:hypothetical protein BJAS_P0455 [Bathymodiolus japonicus methanotrophic gill symbiont]|uniref:SpoIIE family protein phosphatase n=1 Tax=Bathymodiolus japonicus methanotrophic gill symbiont TaxID=113269 RepID=UPI001B715306|nr:SpoIIE family protein phosphatase [Bathymodiolus japonicus methanotrophic gill symbiont]GFO71187.1 hypothetical protein BJAS_P0455 [Bathymodiolus japonicus methanotrophic gill symbiont]